MFLVFSVKLSVSVPARWSASAHKRVSVAGYGFPVMDFSISSAFSGVTLP
jgi:hypothetical protein